MKKSEIRVGGKYLAKVASIITTVRVDRIREVDGLRGRSETLYDVTNLRTGRTTMFRSAAKFRGEVPEPKAATPDISTITEQIERVKAEIASLKEGEQSLPPTMVESTPVQTAEITGATDTAPSSNGLASRIASARAGRAVGSSVAGMTPNEEQEEIIAEAMDLSCRVEGNVLVICAGAGCLAGDTIIHVNRGGKGFQIPIRDLVERQSGKQPVVTRTYQMKGKTVTSTQRNHPWDLSIPTMVARADGEVIRLCRLKEAWYSGDKDTFTVTTNSGRSIRATSIHPFLMDDGGWKQLSELRVGDGIQVNSGRSARGRSGKPRYAYIDTKFHPHQTRRSTSRSRFGVATHRLVVEADMNRITLRRFIWILRHECEMATTLKFLPPSQLVHHKNGNTLDNDLSNLEVVTGQAEHDWGKNVLWKVGFEDIVSIEPYENEPTYDIEVEDDPHNFIANGFVVHNTGKTATLRMLEQILRGRGQYTAFNSSLVNEAKGRFVKCAVNTTHSLAFRAVGKLYAHRLGGERMRSGQVARILGIQPISVTLKGQGPLDKEGKVTDKVKSLSAEFLAGQVMVAIRKFCQSDDPEIDFCHTKYIDGIDSPDEFGKRGHINNDLVRHTIAEKALAAWEDLSRVEGQLPFNHDCYVKLWQLGQGDDRPVIAADYILLDEAQDTAPVFLDVLKQQKHALLVLVGDDNQQIYEWRGAVNAMGAFTGAPRKLLSQSYRFGQAVADVANAVLAELDEPTDLVMRGLSTIPSRVCPVEEPRCYLYRTNAGAVSRVMQAVAEGKRPHLIGGGSDVVAWCEAAVELQAKRPTRHPELCCFESWGEVEEYSRTDEGSDLKLMVKLVNEFGAEEIRDALKNMPKEEDADLVVSTAHKSKGREWDTVRLGPDFPTANRMEDSDRRLLYVAVTRAKLTLDISECPPFCGGECKVGTFDGEETRFVPGLRVTYTQLMPSQEAQEAWLAAKKPTTIDAATSQRSVISTPTQTPNVAAANGVGAPRPNADVRNAGFTWTKFDGGWFVRGPANTPVNTRVTVTRKDGSSAEVTIKVVKHKFNDAWIYGI